MESGKKTTKSISLVQYNVPIFAKKCKNSVIKCPLMRINIPATQVGLSGRIRSISRSPSGQVKMLVDGVTIGDISIIAQKARTICDTCCGYKVYQSKMNQR